MPRQGPAGPLGSHPCVAVAHILESCRRGWAWRPLQQVRAAAGPARRLLPPAPWPKHSRVGCGLWQLAKAAAATGSGHLRRRPAR